MNYLLYCLFYCLLVRAGLFRARHYTGVGHLLYRHAFYIYSISLLFVLYVF